MHRFGLLRSAATVSVATHSFSFTLFSNKAARTKRFYYQYTFHQINKRARVQSIE